jgi:hypothetical protein
MGLGRHVSLFAEQALDELELLHELGDVQLRQMGLEAPERQTLLRAIAALPPAFGAPQLTWMTSHISPCPPPSCGKKGPGQQQQQEDEA